MKGIRRMEYFYVLKATGRGTLRGRSCVVAPCGRKLRNNKKSLRVFGNIPELYYGMSIELDLDEDTGHVQDYCLTLTQSNTIAIQNSGHNPLEYKNTLKKHQILKKLDDKLGWNVAKLSISEIYKKLPFDVADAVHKSFINDKMEITRIEAINENMIRRFRLNNMIKYNILQFFDFFERVERTGAYGNDKVPNTAKRKCLQFDKYYEVTGTELVPLIIDKVMKEKEEYVFDNIKKRLENYSDLISEESITSFIKKIRKDEMVSDEQQEILYCLMDTKPCIVTGGAGTGKTTTIKTLLRCYRKVSNSILLVAPTGKASRRLAEKADKNASTIHRALRIDPEEEFVFYNEERPLDYSLIIVDESSMINTELMYDLLNAVRPTSKIVFVGDDSQLEPVGYGNPFSDFLSMLPIFRLETNYRQEEGTDILEQANNVLKDKQVENGRGVKVKHISFDDIVDVIDKYREERTLPEKFQIISPYNDLNRCINDYLKINKYMDFSIGDKIIMLRNSKSYSNGDIGLVKGYNDDKGELQVLINNKSITITDTHIDEVSLAYSITIHKMQGSEADKVILFLPENDYFCSKKMLYTAITRARKEVEIYFYKKPKMF
jgi:RecD/TraA family predicted helicase